MSKIIHSSCDWLNSIVRIGHYSDNINQTGSTVFLFEYPLKATVILCGNAPATREFAALLPGSTVDVIHGLLLTGGSAFGLDSAAGVLQYQAKRNIGYSTRGGVVPICPAAAIYDLSSKTNIFPTADNIYQTCCEAVPVNGRLSTGNVGVGVGARIGKGPHESTIPSLGGFGIQTSQYFNSSIYMTAFVVVNCWGNVLNSDGTILSGAEFKLNKGHFLDLGLMFDEDDNCVQERSSTTLVALFTNLSLDRCALARIGKMAVAGIARATKPASTPFDGDAIFICTTSQISCCATLHEQLLAGNLAADAIEEAIRNGVKKKQTINISGE